MTTRPGSNQTEAAAVLAAIQAATLRRSRPWQSATAVSCTCMLGDGVRLFDRHGAGQVELEPIEVVEAPGVFHLRFRRRR